MKRQSFNLPKEQPLIVLQADDQWSLEFMSFFQYFQKRSALAEYGNLDMVVIIHIVTFV